MAVLLLVYAPALNGGYVWDDDAWTSKLEPLFRSSGGLWRLWANDPALQQYYPLTATTFWMDWHLWHDWTLPMHVENVLLHGLAAFLLGLLLRRLKVAGAWLAAGVFALHPVMVESTAWITERKNVLSLALALASTITYLRFESEEPSHGANRRRHYLISLSLCVAALLAKVTAFIIPPALLLLGWWRRGRVEWRRDLMPALPFFLVSILLGAFTWWVEKHHVGAEGIDFAAPWAERFISAGRACWFYPVKLLWPADLCFIYPDWRTAPLTPWMWAWPVSVALLVIALWAWRGRMGRGSLTALLFYLGALFPVMGLMNVYGGLFSPVWDHWAYVPAIGVIVPACVMISRGLARLPDRRVAAGFITLLLGTLGVLSWRQCGQYASSEALWVETIRRNPNAWMALNNHGTALGQEGRVEEGISFLRAALAVRPGYAKAHCNLAAIHIQQGAIEDAVEHYRTAVAIDPRIAFFARQNLGGALLLAGRPDEALEQLYASLTLSPDHVETLNNLAVTLLNRGQAEEARDHLHHALRIDAAHAPAWSNLGNAFLALKSEAEAVRCYQHALRIDADLADARTHLKALTGSEMPSQTSTTVAPTIPPAPQGEAIITDPDELVRRGMELLGKGRAAEALGKFYAALDLQPHHVTALNQLADALLQRGRAREASAYLDDVLRSDPKSPLALLNRAIAAFQLGKHAEAVRFNEQAIAAAPESIGALNNFAWLLATCPDDTIRDGRRATGLIRDAIQRAGQPHPVLQRTLGAALAEAGQFDEAISASELALSLAERSGMQAIVTALRDQLTQLRQHHPMREAPPPQR